MNKLLDRYIFSEFIPPFLIGLTLFSFILIMDKVIRIIDLVLIKGIGIKHLGALFIYIIPPLLSFAIPMSVLFATLVTFGRLSSDNEVIALLSSGIHPLRVILPILLFALFALFLCLWMELAVIPISKNAFRSIVLNLQQEKDFLVFNEEEFHELGKDMVFYFKRSKGRPGENGGYDGVLIADQRIDGQSRIILARHADISLDKSEGRLFLSMIDGDIHNLDRKDKNTYERIRFGQYEMNLILSGFKTESNEGKRYKELSQKTLSSLVKSHTITIQDKIKLSLEWHRRIAFPVSCIIFAFLGSFIGMLSRWSGRGSGFAVTIILILFYYFIMIAGYRLSIAQYLPPWISVWLPNLVFSGMCIGGGYSKIL